MTIQKVIVLIGPRASVEQAIAELKSNIQFDHLPVIVKVSKKDK